jgi:predicted glycosyltransferase
VGERRHHDRRTITALLYCHDTFGLGHLRRTLALVAELRRRWPELSALIATGSPLAHRFCLPDGVDYLKLPTVAKQGDGLYAARTLALRFDEISALRRDLLVAAARHLRPDVVLVDNVPGGLAGEVVPALRALRRAGTTRLVLGLRDIVDDPVRVRRAWTHDGSYTLLDEVYDRILVYGDENVFDAVGEYGISAAAAAKTRHVGYLRRIVAVDSRWRRGSLPLVLVTVGGGEDGEPLLRAALAARARTRAARAHWLVVTGPFLARGRRAALAVEAARLPETELVEFVDDLPGAIAAADVVVSMAGYNSVCEILSASRPAVLVPRVQPRTEQLVRARALARRGLVSTIPPDRLTPDVLAREVETLLRRPPSSGQPIDLGGLERAGDELSRLLEADRPAAVGSGGRR